MGDLTIITTADGSHSLLNTTLNETYHSHHGAVQESIHVFIENGLKYFLRKKDKTPVNILEIGFGTGLNALLTVQHAVNSGKQISYTSLEAYPLEKEIWSELNYMNSIGGKDLYSRLHDAEWNRKIQITSNFEILKIKTTLQEIELPVSYFDLVYYDAFAPNKQPEMWTFEMLQKVVSTMTQESVFVTYCAKGQVKRDLNQLGLKVETLPGPPGKKEMIRASGS